MSAYLALFGIAFLAATLVPFYSEFLVVGMLLADHDPLAVLAVATAGNTLGSLFNWVLGRGLERFRERRWFPVSERQLVVAQRWFRKYGQWSLLFAWAPVGGDALTLLAGVLRVRLRWFLPLVGLGKGLRYLAVILATQYAAGGAPPAG
jgi:membrane protein YqaA with SNARE-associated domain